MAVRQTTNRSNGSTCLCSTAVYYWLELQIWCNVHPDHIGRGTSSSARFGESFRKAGGGENIDFCLHLEGPLQGLAVRFSLMFRCLLCQQSSGATFSWGMYRQLKLLSLGSAPQLMHASFCLDAQYCDHTNCRCQRGRRHPPLVAWRHTGSFAPCVRLVRRMHAGSCV